MESRNTILCLISTLIFQGGTLAKGEVCTYTLSEQSGTLHFPVGTENYTNNLNCTWSFVAPPGFVVEITFTTIDLQPKLIGLLCLDVITVYDGILGSNIFTSPFCGAGPPWPRRPNRFVSTSNILSIRMETDETSTGKGFVADYKHVPFRRESIAAINVEGQSIIQFDRFASRLFDLIPLSHSSHPSALDFDPITEFFYYTDIDTGFIGRVKYDASSDEVLVEENVQTPLGVAVGYLTGLLYWTDVGRHEVSVSRLDGTFRKTLVFPNTGCNSPRAIILSADQQEVFWTCARKIMKAKADGSERQTLVDGLSDPRTIVLDEEMFLYWVDVNTSSVGRIKVDGTLQNDALLTHDLFSGVHSFVMDSFTYYWSSPADKSILDVDRVNPSHIGTLSLKDAVTMEGLYYYKSDKSIAQQHTCASDGRTGCQELCFPRGPLFSCVEVTPNVVNCPNEIVRSTTQLYEQVSWEEPSAISRTSKVNGQVLMYDTRTSRPGALFTLGNTTVTYTFQDHLGHTAICSFNVVLLPATTTITTTVLPADCKPIRTLTDQRGTLDYPSDSGNYLNNLNCTWTFIAPAGLVVELTFTKVDLDNGYGNGNCFDTIKVYDGIPGSIIITPPFCEAGPPWPRSPYRFLSTLNILSITMETDGSVTRTGFVAEYKHVPFRRESIAAINAEGQSIIQFDRFKPGRFDPIPLSHSTHPSALDFDPITENFYYTDIDTGFIGRVKYDASLEEIVVAENIETPLGLAVGYLTGLLYWTDVSRHEVSVSRLDGTFRKPIGFPNSGCSSPRAIILSADQQNLFWTCAQEILQAKADGSESQILVDGLGDPRAIALGEDMFLYWVDVVTSSVGRIKADGTMMNAAHFTHELVSGAHSFVMDSFAHFWSRPTENHIIFIERLNLQEMGKFSPPPQNGGTMEGLYYYKSDKTIAPQHSCVTGRAECQGLCFPQGLSYNCVEVVPYIVDCPTEIVMTTSHLYEQVSWKEPSAISRTSQADGQILNYYTRTSTPGNMFTLGNKTVTYTFKDEFSNTAICSFNVVILPATSTIVAITARTAQPAGKSQDFSLDILMSEYFVYIILGVIILLLCIIVLIVVCIACCCCCTCRWDENNRRPSTTQPQHYMNSMVYDNKANINMVPISASAGHTFPARPPPPY